MPAKRSNSSATSKKSDKSYDKTKKVPKERTTAPRLNPSTPPNWQTHHPEWSSNQPEGKNAKHCIDKWCLLPPYDHRVTEDQWESYFKERSALDELNTFGSDASSPIQPDELRPPLRALEDSAANIAAAIYGSALTEESKIAIARTLRGSLYITAADGMEGWQVDLNPAKNYLLTALYPVSPYSFDYRESDFFGLLVAMSNKVGDIDAENPTKCKALKEDGSPQPGSVEVFSWYGGNTVGAATAAELSSFEPTLFGSTGWLSPLKLHNLLLAASTCSQYDDCYQELNLGIAVASGKNLKFFTGETTGSELGEAETAFYKKLCKQVLSGNAEGDASGQEDDDQPGCVPDRLLLLARHK